MDHVSQDNTPTRPTRRPYALPLENGLRRVKMNSIEYDALLAGGYAVLERDDTTAILRLGRRATDNPKSATHGDLDRYRKLEQDVLESLAAELTAVGHPVEASQLRWVMDQFRSRIMHETPSTRTVVSGRLR